MKPFSLADVYKNVETIKSARHSNRLAQTNQQLENEKMLHMAATDIARDPSTADRHIPQLVQAGILNQSAVKEMSPQQLQEGARQILASTTATLKAMNALENDTPNHIGKWNPGDYTVKSWTDATQGGGFDQSKLVRYQDPLKPVVRDVNGVPSVIYPGQTGHPFTQPKTTVEPLSTVEQVGKGQAIIEGMKKTAAITAENTARQNTPAAQKADGLRRSDAQSVISDIDSLLAIRPDGKGKVLSYAYGKSNVLAPDMVKPQEWIDNEAVRDRIVANLQLENVQKLKGTGPITENEQKILKQAASALSNPLISPALAEKELRRVKAMINRWALGKIPDKPSSDLSIDDLINKYAN